MLVDYHYRQLISNHGRRKLIETWNFNGKEYVENGEFRNPQRGEIFIAHTRKEALECQKSYAVSQKRIILIPKKGANMNNYQITDKEISRMSIWESIDDKTCKKALDYYNEFDSVFRKKYKWNQMITFSRNPNTYPLNQFLNDNPELYDWMVRKGFLELQKERWYLEIENPWVAIGEDTIRIIAKSESGDSSYIIFDIYPEGYFKRIGCLHPKIGLELDNNARIRGVI